MNKTLLASLFLLLPFSVMAQDVAPSYAVPGFPSAQRLIPNVNGLCISSDGSNTAVPCAGGSSQSVTQGTTPWAENLTQFGGTAVSLGQKVAASSIPVVLPSTTTIPVGPTKGAPINCGLTTNATPGNPSTAIAANLATDHIALQNNGTAPILFSFVVTTGLNSTNSFSLAAGQGWNNPASSLDTSALTVASGTASQPLACEYH